MLGYSSYVKMINYEMFDFFSILYKYQLYDRWQSHKLIRLWLQITQTRKISAMPIELRAIPQWVIPLDIATCWIVSIIFCYSIWRKGNSNLKFLWFLYYVINLRAKYAPAFPDHSPNFDNRAVVRARLSVLLLAIVNTVFLIITNEILLAARAAN